MKTLSLPVLALLAAACLPPLAAAAELPPRVRADGFELAQVGKGRLTWLGFGIYEAGLWTPDGRFEDFEPGVGILSPTQARDVEAVAAHIVPSGDTPGAREAGVVYFIDHVHAGPYAARAAEFLAGLADFQADFATRNPGVTSFADLPDGAQLAYLKGIETTPFFGTMKFLTVLGLLALPSYGGNAGKLGWKLVGFVDQHAWTPPFGHYDRDYPGFVPYPKEQRS